MADVKLFAALRAASGVGTLHEEAADLTTLLDTLRARYGEPFTARLARSTVVVDGSRVAHDADIALGTTSEVVLLPPFSGG